MEEHLKATGLPFVVVQPNGFMQSLLNVVAATVRERGVVVNPLGTAGISLVDCADAGAAIAVAVCDRALDSETFVLTGPDAPTYEDLARQISDSLGVEVPRRRRDAYRRR